MAKKKPACKTAKNMATSQPGVDSDISVYHGRSTGLTVLALNVLTLTFEGGVLLFQNHIVAESLAEMERKRKAKEDRGFPLNKKYGLPIPKHYTN